MPSSYVEVIEPGSGSYSDSTGNTSSDATEAYRQVHAKVWENTPNYNALKRQGIKISTRGFNGSRVKHRFSHGSWHYYPTDAPEGWRASSGTSIDQYGYIEILAPADPDLGLAWGHIDTQLLSRIKNSSINVANALGEGGKTVSQIADTAKVLAASFRSLRHGNIRDAFRHLGIGAPSLAQGRRFGKKVKKETALKKADFSATGLLDTASTTWLEIQYGWKPLLSDVWGLGNGLAAVAARPYLHRVSASKVSRQRWTTHELGGLGNAINIGRAYETFYSAKKSVEFIVTSNTAKSLAEFGISNPLALAWELLPYSFVVDWFYPIGAFIDSIDATLGCTFLNGTTSYKTLSRHDMYASGSQNIGPFGNWTYGGSKEGFFSVERWFRGLDTSFPGSRLPEFKNPLSSSHLTTSLALLAQAFLPTGKSFSRG